MNKSELVDAIAEKSELSKLQAGKALDAFLETVTDQLSQGIPIQVVGFGSFSIKNRAARIGRNPQTGQPIVVAAAKIPSFKSGKSLKDSCNNK